MLLRRKNFGWRSSCSRSSSCYLSESVSEEIKRRYCSEIVLQEMYHLMVELNGCEENGAAIEGISQRLKTIATDLAGGRC